MLKYFSFGKKQTRAQIIEEKAISIVEIIRDDFYNFTPIEQAKIFKKVNVEFLKNLTKAYNDAYNSQQEVLSAKEIIK